MSILIKRFNKPKNCLECWDMCLHAILGCEADFSGEPIRAYEYMVGHNCPMVEVPTPHGRLIDIDEIMAKHTDWEKGVMTEPTFFELVFAPAVIETEDE